MKTKKQKLTHNFYRQDALKVAPALLGKLLVRKFDDGSIIKLPITEVEAYCGENDLACHASKGRTKRNEIMYHSGGKVYVYLIYGMYWMLNFVTGNQNNPQAVLIRGLKDINGPGKITKYLNIDKTFYGEDLATSERLWVEDNNKGTYEYITTPRIGIDYAGEIWKNKPWRFIIK